MIITLPSGWSSVKGVDDLDDQKKCILFFDHLGWLGESAGGLQLFGKRPLLKHWLINCIEELTLVDEYRYTEPALESVNSGQ